MAFRLFWDASLDPGPDSIAAGVESLERGRESLGHGGLYEVVINRDYQRRRGLMSLKV